MPAVQLEIEHAQCDMDQLLREDGPRPGNDGQVPEHGDLSPLEAAQSPKTREGSARSSAFSKLRTRARRNCEHALVELGGIEPPSVEG